MRVLCDIVLYVKRYRMVLFVMAVRLSLMHNVSHDFCKNGSRQ